MWSWWIAGASRSAIQPARLARALGQPLAARCRRESPPPARPHPREGSRGKRTTFAQSVTEASRERANSARLCRRPIRPPAAHSRRSPRPADPLPASKEARLVHPAWAASAQQWIVAPVALHEQQRRCATLPLSLVRAAMRPQVSCGSAGRESVFPKGALAREGARSDQPCQSNPCRRALAVEDPRARPPSVPPRWAALPPDGRAKPLAQPSVSSELFPIGCLDTLRSPRRPGSTSALATSI